MQKNTLVSVKRIYNNRAPLFNEFNSISVNLDESEAIEFYNLDELTENLTQNPKPKTLNPTTLLEQLALVYVESEIESTMNAHEFIKFLHTY
jgi:hypothetical protein